jgi:hypothetical protein
VDFEFLALLHITPIRSALISSLWHWGMGIFLCTFPRRFSQGQMPMPRARARDFAAETRTSLAFIRCTVINLLDFKIIHSARSSMIHITYAVVHELITAGSYWTLAIVLKLCICVHFALGRLLGSIRARNWRQFIFSHRINEVRDPKLLVFCLASSAVQSGLRDEHPCPKAENHSQATALRHFFGPDSLVTILTLLSLSPIILRSISAQ